MHGIPDIIQERKQGWVNNWQFTLSAENATPFIDDTLAAHWLVPTLPRALSVLNAPMQGNTIPQGGRVRKFVAREGEGGH